MTEEMETGCETRSARRNRLSVGDAVKPMTPIEGAIKRANNALVDLNDFLERLEEKVSPVMASSRPTDCGNEETKNPVEGESGVFNEIEEISNRIWRACARVRDIRDRVEL